MWVYSIVPQMQTCNIACFYMNVCTCIHLFIHACIHRYISACEHVQCVHAFAHTPCIELHMNISMHSYINVCIHTCVHMLVNACKCIHECICTWIIVPMHMCIYMHLQAEINVYMWTEAHVCMCACAHAFLWYQVPRPCKLLSVVKRSQQTNSNIMILSFNPLALLVPHVVSVIF